MNACQYCGACCVSLRVSFLADEVDDCLGGLVPQALTESYGNAACMRTMADGRCVALRGSVGEAVSCAIYELRPSSCREFAPLAALGRGDDACNDARRRRGLPPLV
jgi:Fe-S-cluster containining protein